MNSPTIAELDELDYSDCLRPQATRFLLEDLLIKGQSINLIGAKGQGRTRTFQDMMRKAEYFCQVWQADLKPHRSSYLNFVKAIAQGAGLPPRFKRIEQVFDRLSADAPLLFGLDNLEYLSDHHPSQQKASLDKNYDKDFLAFLNNLHNSHQPPVHLLIPSETQWRNICVNGMYSTLELTAFPLEKLRLEEVRAEISRQFPPVWNAFFQENPSAAQELTKTVYQHAQTYPLIGFLCEALQRDQRAGLAFPQRIKALVQDFKKNNTHNAERKLIGVRKNVQRHIGASGISNLFPSLSGFITKLFRKNED